MAWPRSYRSLKPRSIGLRHLEPRHTRRQTRLQIPKRPAGFRLFICWDLDAIQRAFSHDSAVSPDPQQCRLQRETQWPYNPPCIISWPWISQLQRERHIDLITHLALSASWRRQSSSRETSGVLHWAGQLIAQLLPRARLPTCWPLPGCCLYLPPAWKNWLYLNIDESHFLCIPMFYPRGVDSGKPLHSWAPNAPCLLCRTISGALKANWTFWQLEWCSNRGRGKKERKKNLKD